MKAAADINVKSPKLKKASAPVPAERRSQKLTYGKLPKSSKRTDETDIEARPGTHGFVVAHVAKSRMKGCSFDWNIVGTSLEANSHFEIRPKAGSSKLRPAIPSGTNRIHADAVPGLKAGTIYSYSLWQVLDGQARELDDPDLEIIYI